MGCICVLTIALNTLQTLNEMNTLTKPRLTAAQKRALDAYNFALKQEDRYLGSVFVTPMGQRKVEAKTQAAYAACLSLGMTHEHGL